MDLAAVLPGSSIRCRLDGLAIGRGDIVALDFEAPADGRFLMRILATLAAPLSGQYRFDGESVALDDYRQCLSVKRRVGYVAADAAMISNRTVRENLLLSRFYHENDLSIDLDETMAALCADAGLSGKLHWRPSELSDGELLKAIAIRELGKSPAVMLVDRPENFMAASEDDGLFHHIKNVVQSGTAVVFQSHSRRVTEIAGRRLTLADGVIREAVHPRRF
ncbi:MAG TPA: ATP-binding cassette domain-containing protein [Desulfosarcina sp.]|nr:ATP-binding cassette domain-containing protein [Desulfosarcina sp.]